MLSLAKGGADIDAAWSLSLVCRSSDSLPLCRVISQATQATQRGYVNSVDQQLVRIIQFPDVPVLILRSVLAAERRYVIAWDASPRR